MIVQLFGRMNRYYIASPLPTATGIFSLAVSLSLAFWSIRLLKEGEPAGWVLFLLMSLGWMGLASFALADSMSRYREYRRMRRLFSRYGLQRRIL